MGLLVELTAFLPQFINPAAPQAVQYLTMVIVFATLDGLIMFGYAAPGSRAAQALRGSAAKWLDRLCRANLLALAGSLALRRRATD